VGRPGGTDEPVDEGASPVGFSGVVMRPRLPARPAAPAAATWAFAEPVDNCRAVEIRWSSVFG